MASLVHWVSFQIDDVEFILNNTMEPKLSSHRHTLKQEEGLSVVGTMNSY